MLIDTRKSANARVSPVPALNVDWNEGLWKDRFNACADITVPHIRQMFEDTSPTFHVVENFRVAAGLHNGTHQGTPFGDGDFYKWMEAAIYVMAKRDDKKLAEDIDSYIDLIASVQQPDGYISTKQIIADKQGGNSRLGDINDFEVYNFGHLFTAACIHKRITGKDNFLNVALHAAEYLENLYKKYIEEGEAQTEVCPSHYMGLVELYRVTGNPRYLRLAEMALQVRDLVKNGFMSIGRSPDMQYVPLICMPELLMSMRRMETNPLPQCLMQSGKTVRRKSSISTAAVVHYTLALPRMVFLIT